MFKDASITLQNILIPFGNAGLVRAPGFCLYTVEALFLILGFKASRLSCGLEQLYSLRNLLGLAPHSAYVRPSSTVSGSSLICGSHPCLELWLHATLVLIGTTCSTHCDLCIVD